ncbi:MAG: universal stress protein [Proteobacteria bacterium]|nr:universal stress protein [Pseudomonadota bacterium]
MAEEKQTAAKPRAQRVFLVVVDETEEMHQALYFASLRAKGSGGRVALLRVIEPVEFQHWAAVGNLMRQERREEAEQLLQKLAADAAKWSGDMPVLYIREGAPAEELIKLIDEEKVISILVLGAATGPEGPGPLVSALTGRMAGRLRVPVTVVPGTLSDEQIEALA